MPDKEVSTHEQTQYLMACKERVDTIIGMLEEQKKEQSKFNNRMDIIIRGNGKEGMVVRVDRLEQDFKARKTQKGHITKLFYSLLVTALLALAALVVSIISHLDQHKETITDIISFIF